MCLALPALLIDIHDDLQATVDLGGVRKTISIALVPDAQPGDYVIVHVGNAIGRIDPEEAARTLALFEEMAHLNVELNAPLDTPLLDTETPLSP